MLQLIRALIQWVKPVSRHLPARTAPQSAASPSTYSRPAPPPTPRSPYGLDIPLDGTASTLVRPYLLADERRRERARQRQRRLALVLAADFGIDLDTRDLHGLGVA